MKISMFVSNPFTNDPRVYNEARSLVQAGHQVTVIAWDREKQNPERQMWDGIEVVRVKTWLSPGHGLGSLPWHGFHLLLWQWQAYRLALALHKESAFSVVHCHDFDTLLAGIWLKRKLDLPLIYDAHESYGYMAAALAPGWVGDMLLRLERWLITKTDRIIAVTEPQKGYFGGITDKSISVIMNCKALQSLEYQPPEDGGKFTLLYVGILDKTRALSQLIHVVKEIPGVHCVIGGIGQPGYVEALRGECDRSSNITFLGTVPFDQVIPMTRKADCSFLMVNPRHPNSRIAFGNKQFEAMVCGRPIICTKGTYSGEVTERERVGLAVEYTAEALRQAIIKLRDDPALRERLGRNALRAAITKYNWQREGKKLLELYRSIKP
jgi:glycosyltransferase involved in cell wall biosynthesis